MVKLVIIHIIATALLILAYFNDGLSLIWQADKFYAIPIIGSLTLYALYMVARSSLEGALWVADKLPVVGLALTVVGLLWAVKGGYSENLITDATHALVGNLAGIVAYAWIELCVWVKSK